MIPFQIILSGFCKAACVSFTKLLCICSMNIQDSIFLVKVCLLKVDSVVFLNACS